MILSSVSLRPSQFSQLSLMQCNVMGLFVFRLSSPSFDDCEKLIILVLHLIIITKWEIWLISHFWGVMWHKAIICAVTCVTCMPCFWRLCSWWKGKTNELYSNCSPLMILGMLKTHSMKIKVYCVMLSFGSKWPPPNLRVCLKIEWPPQVGASWSWCECPPPERPVSHCCCAVSAVGISDRWSPVD